MLKRLEPGRGLPGSQLTQWGWASGVPAKSAIMTDNGPGDPGHDGQTAGWLECPSDLDAGLVVEPEEATMLWTIFVILLVLWLLGVVTSYTLGGFIHVLLVVAVVLAVMQLLQGRRAL
jgi:hypothetical protein